MPYPNRKIDLSSYRREVEAGLPNERQLMDLAAERQAFYDYEGERFERHFRRDAESSFDFQGRSHRSSGFLRMCVEVLCDHVYSPGPARRWSEPSGDEILQRVYADNLFDSLMLEADSLATLNGSVAIQIDAGEGDFTLKPITYRLWGREQFCVWVDPNNATVPLAVCTKDMHDGQTRYRLWSKDEVWTFLTKKKEETSSDGQAAYLVTGTDPVTGLPNSGPHNYGVLPFSFIHYRLPIRQFFNAAVGDFLWKAEISIDDRLMRLDESINKHMNPVPWAKGMPKGWKPDIEAQRFLLMPMQEPRLDASGNYQPGEPAEIGYAQVTIDVAGAWEDCWKYRECALDSAHIPLSAIRMEQQGIASGISLIVEQEPLIKRAEKRRSMYKVYETDLGRRTLICAGNHYGKAALRTAGEKGSIVASWPQPRLAVNTPDKLEMGVQEVQTGLKSHLMLIMDWYNVCRDDALEIVKQIKEDTEELSAAYPELAAANALPEPDEEGPSGSGANEDDVVPSEEDSG